MDLLKGLIGVQRQGETAALKAGKRQRYVKVTKLAEEDDIETMKRVTDNSVEPRTSSKVGRPG